MASPGRAARGMVKLEDLPTLALRRALVLAGTANPGGLPVRLGCLHTHSNRQEGARASDIYRGGYCITNELHTSVCVDNFSVMTYYTLPTWP